MSKKKVGIIALIIIIISAVVMVFAYGIKNKQVVVSEDDKMKIVVTSFPQYDFARAVAGDKANIQMLIKPGVYKKYKMQIYLYIQVGKMMNG